ncbi:MAG TPA: glycosyltransferase family 4 protein [Tepidisphaeraceae bacterium]|nr:glycosyltransferase family 4 protein [Tepidisphaeraceae bacterium]
MNVALIILHADPSRGGAERYTLDLAVALAKRGRHVSVLATSFAEDWPAGVTPVPLVANGLTRAKQYRRFLDAVDAQVAATRYDVVHAMLPVRTCDVYHPHAGLAVEKEQQTGLRLLFNRRRKLMAEVERALLTGPKPPIVLSLSEYVKRDIVRHYPALSDRLVTLFNAVATDYFDPEGNHDHTSVRPGRGIADEEVVALIVAQDFERKGVPQAVAATRRINVDRQPGQPRLRLLVVGKHRPAVDGDVIYAGVNWKVVLFYAAADFFVLPTKHDPCSLVVLEALAMGLPVISTRFNGACEVVADGVHGFVLDDPNDLDALAGAMRKLMDPELRAQMREACLALRPRLSYETHLDDLTRVYERVQATRGPTRSTAPSA